MGHFHDTCAGNEKLAPLVREIRSTFDLLIMLKCKDELEGEFYLLIRGRKTAAIGGRNLLDA